MTSIRLLSGITVYGLLWSGLASTQAPAAAPPSVVTVGFMHAIHATNEVEKTLAFYRDVFGVYVKDPHGLNIELVGAPSAPAK